MARILVVDDNEPFRKALARIIASLGHSVVEAGDGQEAVEVLRAAPVDLVMTDVYMPDMDGIEFLLHLQEHHPDIPVVAMSGGGAASKDFVLEDAQQLGAAAVLPKPLTADVVEAAIRETLVAPEAG